jgi:hypothetical protein
MLGSGKSAAIPKEFPADFVIKKAFPADLEFLGKSAGISKNFPADFG